MTEAAAPLVLVHGAWHGPWCWSRLIPLLEQRGREVYAPCLPGHETMRQTQPARINMRHYQQALRDYIIELNHPVVLVGHSMAGLLIASLADMLPAQIRRLVFLNAFLPSDGDSVFSLMALLSDSGIPSIAQHMVLSENRLTYSLAADVAADYFYNQCPLALQSEAQAQLCPQPSLPLASPVRLGEAYAATTKTCLFSNHDQVIVPQLQRHMRRRQSCEEWLQLDGDHSPFFSAPASLAAILAEQH